MCRHEGQPVTLADEFLMATLPFGDRRSDVAVAESECGCGTDLTETARDHRVVDVHHREGRCEVDTGFQ